jgi:lipopolysaccharide export system protein LptC
MSNHSGQNSAQRLRIIMFITLLVALLLGSFWILKLVRQGDDTVGAQRIPGKPDYYMEEFKYVKMAVNGRPRYDISGERMTHLPDTDSYEVTMPVFTSLDSNKAPMTLRAKRGYIEDDQTKIHLYENVRANREPFKNSQRMQLTSEYLLLLPDANIIKTDKPVEITMGSSVMNSTGMTANNELQELRLLNNVRGTYRQDMRNR